MPRLLLFSLLLLAACAPIGSASPTPPPTLPPTLTPTPPPSLTPTPPPTLPPTLTPTPPPSVTPVVETPLTPTPGLIVRGRVHLQDGSGLAGVSICRSYASYAGTVVATTDANGSFQSDFAFIPGDEMVSVWPLAAGYTFDPHVVYWRHYYGPEDRTLNFIASAAAATSVPPTACP